MITHSINSINKLAELSAMNLLSGLRDETLPALVQ